MSPPAHEPFLFLGVPSIVANASRHPGKGEDIEGSIPSDSTT